MDEAVAAMQAHAAALQVGTVRAQVRDILAKTGSETLRGLAALTATLSADQKPR